MTGDEPAQSIKDSLAQQEATAVANRNLDEATRVFDFRWRRDFQNVLNVVMIVISVLTALGWISGFIIAGLNLVLPARDQWMSDAHQHELYAWLTSGALTGFATSYLKARI